MISSEEFSAAMRGTWRLLNRDTGGYGDFNVSMEGLRNSFTAIVIVAPIYLFIIATSNNLATPPQPTSYGRELLALLVEWAAFIGLAVVLVRLLGLAGRLVPFLIAYNWSAVFIVFSMVPPALLSRYGLLGANGLVVASIAVTLVALYFRWFIARTALATTAGVALALTAIDVIISLLASALIR
ncbi:hypothetical protein [Rhodoligotrophos defluvii]|uniref:hypothetical protein n=1 Tax=Rhodoligotrophos defluvii TaxID=2561934 RepID=UPI0010C999C4|nr:hypothetical protein [Rhodoligotrophos defluvii]